MSQRILLINPWIYDFSAYDFWMKPLGLLYMASYLRKNGLDVQLIDCLDSGALDFIFPGEVKRPARKQGGQGKFIKEKVAKPEALAGIPKPYHRYGLPHHALSRILKGVEKPQLILITSMMTYWYPGVFDVISMVKDIFPAVPVILGGIYATLCRDHAQLAGADHVLPGPGERHISFIMNDILRETVRYVPDEHDLDQLPYPAFDLLAAPEQVPLLTSRGCPFHCTYCASRLLNNCFDRRNPIQVVNEMVHWQEKLGVRNFSFYDDALLSDPQEMAIPMLTEIIRRKLDCHFHCPNGLHIREITPEIARLLYQAGFRTIRFGLETTHEQRQQELGGKVDNAAFERAAAYLQEAGYAGNEIGVYLLCGLPGQTAREIRESILYVHARGARPILAEYSPLPGTLLWDDARRASSYPLAEEPLYHNNSLLPCASPSLTTETYHELKGLTRQP
ncbi:MAG: radical SAM protein [Deltaproteobacteria bacterium]|nr:radical SAM protein [Deltaproteobacteria bacterium]